MSDFNEMQPNEKPGKMYGSPKVHKGIPEGQAIPPCQPIISNSAHCSESRQKVQKESKIQCLGSL